MIWPIGQAAGATHELALRNREIWLELLQCARLPYREPVPGLQILHCLQADEEGGESLFVDGFAAVVELRAQDPPAFDTLARVPVPFAFRDDCADLRAERCLLELDSDGEIAAIHYNSRAIRPVCLRSEELVAFYRAYRVARLLRDPRFEFRVKLGSGSGGVQ